MNRYVVKVMQFTDE